MSSHPNVILMCVLQPAGPPDKAFADIAAEQDAPIEYGTTAILKGLGGFIMQLMVSDYDDSYQITAPKGSIVVHDYVTYGHGDAIEWEELNAKKEKLAAWARLVCDRHNCTHAIQITANYR